MGRWEGRGLAIGRTGKTPSGRHFSSQHFRTLGRGPAPKRKRKMGAKTACKKEKETERQRNKTQIKLRLGRQF